MSTPDLARARPLFGMADVLALCLSLLIGATALLIGWWGTSGTADQTDQLTWLNLAVAGLVISGAGIAVWLLGGSRRVTRSREELRARWPSRRPVPAIGVAYPGRNGAATVTAPRMTRYHRADCPLMAGKQAEILSSARVGTLHPCGMCQPEEASVR